MGEQNTSNKPNLEQKKEMVSMLCKFTFVVKTDQCWLEEKKALCCHRTKREKNERPPVSVTNLLLNYTPPPALKKCATKDTEPASSQSLN